MCTADNNTLEIIAIVLSGISLLASIGIAGLEIYKNKKINDINLESEFSKDTVQLYLTKRFPEAVNEICFTGEKLSQIDNLQNCLNTFRNELKYFRYCDIKFFEKLKKKLQTLEDYIVANEGKRFDADDQTVVQKKIVDSMTDIYKTVKKKYKNG